MKWITTAILSLAMLPAFAQFVCTHNVTAPTGTSMASPMVIKADDGNSNFALGLSGSVFPCFEFRVTAEYYRINCPNNTIASTPSLVDVNPFWIAIQLGGSLATSLNMNSNNVKANLKYGDYLVRYKVKYKLGSNCDAPCEILRVFFAGQKILEFNASPGVESEEVYLPVAADTYIRYRQVSKYKVVSSGNKLCIVNEGINTGFCNCEPNPPTNMNNYRWYLYPINNPNNITTVYGTCIDKPCGKYGYRLTIANMQCRDFCPPNATYWDQPDILSGTSYRLCEAEPDTIKPPPADTFRFKTKAAPAAALEQSVVFEYSPGQTMSWVNMRIAQPATVKSIVLVDAMGRRLRNISGGSITANTRMDISGLGAGVYFIQLLLNDGTSLGTKFLR